MIRAGVHRTGVSGFACLLLLPTLVLAQATLPAELVSAEKLSDAQARAVTEFVRPWVRQLSQSEEADKVAQARARLLDAFELGGSRDFTLRYSTAISSELLSVNALAAEKPPLNRLSTMVVVSGLIDTAAVRLIESGLKDDNAAVRYWAAKAVQQVGSRDTLTPADRAALLRASATALTAPQDPVVAEQLIAALAGIDTPEAGDQLMDALLQRAALYDDPATANPAAELAALRSQFVRLAGAKGQGAEPPKGLVQKLVLVAFRYLSLSVRCLEADSSDRARVAELTARADLTDKVLRWCLTELASGKQPPAVFENELRNSQIEIIRLRVEEWRALLMTPPLSLTRDQLGT